MACHLQNGMIVTPAGQGVRAERGTIVIEGNRIGAVAWGAAGAAPRTSPGDQVIDASRFVVIPGLVDAHSHFYGVLAPGLIERLPLDVRVPYLSACVGGWQERDTYVLTALGAARMLANGTTTALENVLQGIEATGPAIQALLAAGMRAVVGPMIADRPYSETMPGLLERVPDALRAEMVGATPLAAKEQVDACLELAARWHGAEGRIAVCLSPSAPHRSTDELLALVARAARERGLGVHTHLLETRPQAVVARRLYGRSMVEHLDALGLLGPWFSGAHSVWLGNGDLDLLADRGAGVSHNPVSNLYLGSGIARVPELVRRGVAVGLGSDGTNCGSSTSLFEVMKFAAVIHRLAEDDPACWPSAVEAFRMATIGGAQALGLGAEVGSIEAGKRADLVLVDADAPGLVPLNDPVVQLVFGATNADVRTVFVDGRIVLDERRPTGVDPGALVAEARELGRRVAARARERFARLAPLEPLLIETYLSLVREYEAGFGE